MQDNFWLVESAQGSDFGYHLLQISPKRACALELPTLPCGFLPYLCQTQWRPFHPMPRLPKPDAADRHGQCHYAILVAAA